jgi:hypothetical protein
MSIRFKHLLKHCYDSRQENKTHTLLRPVSQCCTCDSGDVLLQKGRSPPPPNPSKLLPYESLIPFAGYCPSRFRSDHLWTTPSHTNYSPLRRRFYLHYELLRTLRIQISSALPYFPIRQYGKVLMLLRSKMYCNNRSYFSSYFTVNITGSSL